MSPAYTQCNHCGKSIQVSLSKLAKGRGRYCSRACGNAARGDGTDVISVSTLFPAAGGLLPENAPDRHTSAGASPRAEQCPGTAPDDSASYKERFLPKPFYQRGSAHYWSKRVQRRRPKAVRESGVYFQRQAYSLVQCPWESAALGPVRYDSDFLYGPDPMLGF